MYGSLVVNGHNQTQSMYFYWDSVIEKHNFDHLGTLALEGVGVYMAVHVQMIISTNDWD